MAEPDAVQAATDVYGEYLDEIESLL